MKLLPTLSFLVLPLPAQVVTDAAAPKPPSPQQLVHAAMLDYVEGIYDVEPARIARTVARDLDKVGVLRRGADKKLALPKMTYAELHELAGTYNKDGKRIPKDAPKKVEVLGVAPQVAVAKLTAAWGIDYIQLHKGEKGWHIKQVMWQRQPKPTDTAEKDRAAVVAAAKGYVHAFYRADPELIDAHVAKDLAKYGCYHGQWGAMSFAQVRSLSTRAFPSPPKGAPEDVDVLDLADQTAVVKLTAAWGIDFINLARTDEGWKIRQVIWQSHPPKGKGDR